MKALSVETSKILATRIGWSGVRAKGYIDGIRCRRRGKVPSQYAAIGIDEYALGFRAGYFERQHSPVKIEEAKM